MLPGNTRFLSPCYPYRGLFLSETVKDYVLRLAEELENEIQRIGPMNVAGFIMEPVVGAVSILF